MSDEYIARVAELRATLRRLLQQIELNDYRDPKGNKLTMTMAFLNAKRAVAS
jgi:hypothetical protein